MLRYRDSESLYVGMTEAALCALRSQVHGVTCCAALCTALRQHLMDAHWAG